MTNDGRFEAIVQSEGINCESKIAVDEDRLLFESPEKSLLIPYANIDLFYIQSYRMYIQTDIMGQIMLSRMVTDIVSM